MNRCQYILYAVFYWTASKRLTYLFVKHESLQGFPDTLTNTARYSRVLLVHLYCMISVLT